MKKMTCMFLFACAAMISFAAADTPEARKAAADAYVKTFPAIKQLVDSTIEASMKSLPEEQRASSKKVLDEINWNLVETAMREAMVKIYTVDEINAITKFHASPEGKSIMQKTPEFMAAYMKPLAEEARRVVVKMIAESMAEVMSNVAIKMKPTSAATPTQTPALVAQPAATK